MSAVSGMPRGHYESDNAGTTSADIIETYLTLQASPVAPGFLVLHGVGPPQQCPGTGLGTSLPASQHHAIRMQETACQPNVNQHLKV